MLVFGEKTPVQNFYSQSVIFVTGGTGYVGGCVIEKLIRSCPDLKKIYVLVREKKGKTAQERLADSFNNISFDLLRDINPNFKDYIQFMHGDIIEENLGLSEENITTIINEVNIIFHIAAAMRFHESIKKAILSNVRATRDLLRIAERCKDLKAFVHLSTAFSHCYLSHVEEKFYDMNKEPEEIIQCCLTHDEKEAEKLVSGTKYPNNYTFSKGLGEKVVEQFSHRVPISIVRPSIIYGCYADPLPGWIDNLYGPIGLMLGVGLGVIHVVLWDTNIVSNNIPVDLVANCVIVAGYDANKRCLQNNSEPKIFNICMSKRNPFIWQNFRENLQELVPIFASTRIIWFPFIFMVKNKTVYSILNFFLHYLPAYIINFSLKLMGRKESKLLFVYKKMDELMPTMQIFFDKKWTLDDSNTENLYRQQDRKDKIIYNFDVTKVQIPTLFFHLASIIRTHLLKDPLNTIPAGKRHLTRITIIHFIFCSFLLIVGIFFFMSLYKYVFTIF